MRIPTINKNQQPQKQMLRANRQLIPDRQLFNTLHKHHHISQMHCQPHIPNPNPTLTPTSITSNTPNTSTSRINQHILQQFQHLLQYISSMEEKLVGKVLLLDSRVNQINMYINRMHAVIKFRRSSRLYSFANSPNSKNNNEEDAGSMGNSGTRLSRNNVPPSATKYKYDTVYKQGLGQTQPRTRHKQQQQQQQYHNQQWQQQQQQDDDRQQVAQNTDKNTYFTTNIQSLHNQITELKQYLQRTHPTHPIPSTLNQPQQKQSKYIQPTHSLSQSIQKYQQQIKSSYQPQPSIQDQNNLVERYKGIMLQYQKQESLLRNKIHKYRNSLYEILSWLKNMKQVQLKTYLPCQACHIKTIIQQYLNPNNNNNNQMNIQIPSPANPTNKNNNKLSHGQLAQVMSNYEDMYEQLQSMRPASEVDENLSDKDSLLMEYDVGGSQNQREGDV